MIKNQLNLVQTIIKTLGALKYFRGTILVKPVLFQQSEFNAVIYEAHVHFEI